MSDLKQQTSTTCVYCGHPIKPGDKTDPVNRWYAHLGCAADHAYDDQVDRG